MTNRPSRDYPSPWLSAEQVRDILIECNAAAGAAGGAIGGAAGGAIGGGGGLAAGAGAAGGASGGRTGGRLGAKLFTRVMGHGRILPVPYSADAHTAISASLKQILPVPDAEEAGEQILIGLAGTGWMNMNTAVIQLLWHPDHAEVTAHALEGIVNQRSVPKALDTVEQTLSPFRTP